MCADSDSEDEAILAPPPRKLVAAWDGGRVRKLVLYEWSTCLQAAYKRSVVSAQVVYTELRLMQTKCMRTQHAMQMSSGLPLSAQHLASVHRVMSQRSSDGGDTQTVSEKCGPFGRQLYAESTLYSYVFFILW